MEANGELTNYWFTIEPYVFISVTNKKALLYNTLDKNIIESERIDVIKLLQEVLVKENCGVILLTHDRYVNNDIKGFIMQLRENFMGDIIDVNLSTHKPIQLLPYYNYVDRKAIMKDIYYTDNKYVLENLLEISLYIDSTFKEKYFIPILHSIPRLNILNLIGDVKDVLIHDELLSYLNICSSVKYLHCSYLSILDLPVHFDHTLVFKISIDFPIDLKKWNIIMDALLDKSLLFECVFNIYCDSDCLQAERLIEEYNIKKYRLNPVYNGVNLSFLRKMYSFRRAIFYLLLYL